MRFLTPAMLTLGMFGVVGLLVAGYVAKNLLAREDAAPQVTTRNVPMAVADIPAGTAITENHLGQGPFPIDKLDRDMLLVNRVIVGRITKEDIKAAQPIRANQLLQPGELPALNVSEGKRAVTIEVGDSTALVDGLVKPLQYVDVLFTFNPTSSTDDRYQGGLTMRLFEGVKVLAINRSQQQSRIDRQNRVTLELTETQANIVVLAKDRGKLTLTYNPNGEGTGGLALTNAERVTLYDILGLKAREPDKEPFATEFYRGAGRALVYFNDRGRRLEGWNGSRTGIQGFDYRGYIGAPNGPASGNGGYDYTLPQSNTAPAPAPAPGTAPTADRIPMPVPLFSNDRTAPTAALPVPSKN